ASVLAPRAIVNAPAIGQRSARTERLRLMRAAMPELRRKEKGAPESAPRRLCRMKLVEAPRRVRQHGVDLAGIRGEIAARRRLPALILRDLVQQPLELTDIAVDGRLELAIAAVPVA